MTGALGAEDVRLAQQRAGYLAARAAIERGAASAWSAMAPALRGYPLYPYLVFAELRRRLDRADAAEVEAFLDDHAELPLAPRLRGAWLEELALRGDWRDFLAFEVPDLDDVELRCHALTARLATGSAAPLTSRNSDLWLAGRSRPKACDPVFAHWSDTGQLTDALRLERARLAALAGQPGLARYLGRPLGSEERAVIDQWLEAVARPERELAALDRWPAKARRADFVGALVRKLARHDILAAYRVWPRAARELEPEQRLAAERDLAVLRATDYGPDAVARLAALPREAVNQQVLEWRVRVAIARGDWRTVVHQVEEMPDGEREDARWRYWWARATEALGRGDDARDAFAALAAGANYHGYLSADRLQAPYVLCPSTEPVSPLGLRLRPGLVRALELFAVEQYWEARQEWNRAVRGLDGTERLAAALLAAERGWHHQAILEFAELGRLDRYRERFPVAWPQAVADGASRQALPPSLIYAVMRSESALAPDARSGAGAYGLMQLLPSTARSLERRAGVRVPNRSRLFDPETNIRLGSAYLRKLLDDHQHPLHVLAAYNAGPRPLTRWTSSGRLPDEPDRWVETLPYRETREYIPRVLTFQAIYEWQLSGRMTRLSRMMVPLDQPAAWPRRWESGPVEPVCAADHLAALPDD